MGNGLPDGGPGSKLVNTSAGMYMGTPCSCKCRDKGVKIAAKDCIFKPHVSFVLRRSQHDSQHVAHILLSVLDIRPTIRLEIVLTRSASKLDLIIKSSK